MIKQKRLNFSDKAETGVTFSRHWKDSYFQSDDGRLTSHAVSLNYSKKEREEQHNESTVYTNSNNVCWLRCNHGNTEKGIEVLDHLHLADDLDTATKKEIEKKHSGKKIQFIESGRTEEKRFISYEDFMAHSMTEKDWNDHKAATAESAQASK